MNIFTARAKWIITFAFAALLITGVYTGCQNSGSGSNPSQNLPTSVNQHALSASDLGQTIAIQNRHTDELMAIDGVIGTGTGVNDDGSPAVYVFTNRPAVAGIPSAVEGVRTRVENIGEVKAFAFTGTYRTPMYSGVSVGNDKECAAGTISCVVRDRATGTHQYLLSNNHVFARVNAATIGERIDQQGRYDAIPQCAQTGQVASLSNFIPINFARKSTNRVDCAIAEISGGIAATSMSATTNYTPTNTTLAATVGMQVKKTGRTTGFTQGAISAINVTVSVSYGQGKTAKFVGQIYITSTTFSAAGDSGSLIVENSSNDPVGLLFAGSSNSTIANPIGDVLNALAIDIQPN
ncbi:MAG: hypothetical protein Q8916_01760 [Bacteroidota bacterium]|nr:hypothetical protein [Bacteroidota bacterium]MDP4236791.1 hypothetical protein [Bacteroidota bacterium]